MSAKTWALIIAVSLLFSGAVFVNAASRVVDIVCVGTIIGIFWLRDKHKTTKIYGMIASNNIKDVMLAGYADRLAAHENTIKLLESQLDRPKVN